MDSSPPALHEGHWTVVRGPCKGLRAAILLPWTKGRGPLSPLGLTSAPAHALRNMDRGPLTFANKDWVFLLAAYDGLSGGRIRPNSTLLDG